MAVTLFAELTVTAPSRVVPTVPVNVILPPAVSPKLNPPSSVLEKRIFPTPVPVFNVAAPINATGLANERFCPFVTILPLKFVTLLPVPLSVKPPSAVIVTAAPIAKVPEWVIEIGPPLPDCVVMLARIEKLVPVRLIPAAPVVNTTPLKVVVPLPAL